MQIPRWNVVLGPKWSGAAQAGQGSKAAVDTLRGPFEKVDSSRYARVYRADVSISGRSVPVYIKFYLYRSFRDRVKDLLGIGRAVCSMQASKMLMDNGFLCPAVVALCQRRFSVGESVLITESIEDAKSVFDAFFAADSKTRREIARELGACIGRLHKAGIVHGDLRPGNVLLRRQDGQMRFYFLDNERTRKYTKAPFQLCTGNLVQMNLHHEGILRTERMRFFRAYMLENPDMDRKEIFKAVAKETIRRRKKKGLI